MTYYNNYGSSSYSSGYSGYGANPGYYNNANYGPQQNNYTSAANVPQNVNYIPGSTPTGMRYPTVQGGYMQPSNSGQQQPKSVMDMIGMGAAAWGAWWMGLL